VLIAQGDFATAQAHLERALQITEAQFPPTTSMYCAH